MAALRLADLQLGKGAVMFRSLWFTVMILVGLSPAGALACKYSVRDVAFVDLDPSGYRLVLLTDQKTPAELTARLHGAAAGVLVDTNVRLQMVRADDDLDPQLKALVAALDGAPLPAAVLVAADGRTRPVAIPSDTSQENLWAAFEKVVSSEVREKVLDEALKSHSVVLVVEGRDDRANRRAREIAAGAIDQARRGLANLPKPIEHPPQLLVLSAADAKDEMVLLWSLQIDQDDDSMAHIAVLYGRGRRLGPVLDVPGATRAELSRLLWYVGQDCECDLDRSWMQGVMIPHRWDMQMQARAVKRLGFDAGSPMVIAEISRILTRGPSATGSTGDPLGLDDPLMGYRELVIVEPAETGSDETDSGETGLVEADRATAQEGEVDAANDGRSAARPSAIATPPARRSARAPQPAVTQPTGAAAAETRPAPTTVESPGPADPSRVGSAGIGWAVGLVLVALLLVAAIGGGLVWIRSAREA